MEHTDRPHDTQKTPTAPDHLAREVARLVEPLAQASLISPEDAEVTLGLDLGQVGVRPFLSGLAQLEQLRGTVPLLMVMIGTVSFDGFSSKRTWNSRSVLRR